jgi:myotubularin-related protein 1/2
MAAEDLVKAWGFRTKSRGIAIVWKTPGRGNVLARCSQPRVGVTKKRNAADEQFIESIALWTKKTNAIAENSKAVVIIDARPRVNAVGNAVNKGGYESTDVYTSCEFMFAGIPNIHVVREAFTSLRDTLTAKVFENQARSTATPTKRLTKDGTREVDTLIERYSDALAKIRKPSGNTKCKWLLLVAKIIQGAVRIVNYMQNDSLSVVCHCSDGWDRTAQLCSLAEMLMDPYYRTITGFAVLIEKEWLSFGHKFAERLGHDENRDPFDRQRSPIFTQFIDCVFQLVSQFPERFEFTPTFLADLVYNAYSCRFGTFLYNYESVRWKLELYKTTVSVWSEMLDNPRNKGYLNPIFEPTDELLVPRCSAQCMGLFLQMYKIWDQDLVKLSQSDFQEVVQTVNGLAGASMSPKDSLSKEFQDDDKDGTLEEDDDMDGDD